MYNIWVLEPKDENGSIRRSLWRHSLQASVAAFTCDGAEPNAADSSFPVSTLKRIPSYGSLPLP